jgi:glycine cleavage system H protein
MKYSQSHGWALLKGEYATVGITHFAQKELGEIVYVELPHVGESINAEDIAAVLESTKAATDIYSPLSGEIVEVNHALVHHPKKINLAAETDGWLFKLKLTTSEEYDKLMDQESYNKFVT